MQDNRYKNMWGEDLAEQKKRREWLRQVYDKATKPDTNMQTLLNQEKTTHSQKQMEDNNFFNRIYNTANDTYNQANDSAKKLNKDKTINYVKGNSNYKNYPNIWKDSFQDLYADARGIFLGAKNPDEDCDDLISKIYPRYNRSNYK